jgi:hypothetical protein
MYMCTRGITMATRLSKEVPINRTDTENRQNPPRLSPESIASVHAFFKAKEALAQERLNETGGSPARDEPSQERKTPRIGSVTKEPFRAENHFLPRLYLRGFADAAGQVAVYRTLVSHSTVRTWESSPTKSIGRIRHLYSLVNNGELSDELETWLARDFEDPAGPALSKALSDERLDVEDWHTLIRFAGAQDVRTPTRLREMLERIKRWIPDHHAELVDQIAQQVDAVTASKLRKLRPPEVGHDQALFNMKKLLTDSLPKVPVTGWTILKPAPGFRWFTSDAPLLRLNFYGEGRYDFNGGWNNPGGNLILPLGPQHLLIRQVGLRLPIRGTVLSEERTREMRRLLAEHAAELIVAAQPDPEIETLRPRLVDPTEFEKRLAYQRSIGEALPIEKGEVT